MGVPNQLGKIKRILMIHISGRIGDSLFATPAIVATQKNLPDVQIDLLANKNQLALFDNIPGVNVLGSISNKRARMRGWFTFNKYDYVIVFNYGEPLQQVLRYAMRIGKRVIAFEVPKDKINKKLFYCVPHHPFYEKTSHNNEHMVDAYLKLLKPLKINSLNRRIKFFLSAKEKKEAETMLNNAAISQKFLIGYKMTSLASRAYRDWPIDNFIEISNRIIRAKPNVHFILFGGEDECQKIEQVINNLG